MDVADWQKRLERHFTTEGCVGGTLLEVLEREQLCEKHFFDTFHGQAVLIHSFQGFFIETLKKARSWVKGNGWPPNCPSYAFIYIYYLVMFRRFKAC